MGEGGELHAAVQRAVSRPVVWSDAELNALLAAASAIGHQESRSGPSVRFARATIASMRAVAGTREGIYDNDLDAGTVFSTARGRTGSAEGSRGGPGAWLQGCRGPGSGTLACPQ